MNRATIQHPTVDVCILPNGLYRAVATNGIASAPCTSGRPGSAIAGALADLRLDHANTASECTVTSAAMHSDDVRSWIGRTVELTGAN